jgi:putative endonuclease
MRRAPSAAWSVYLLRCADGSLYAGSTTDPRRRLDEHRRGLGGAYTRARCPVRLVYTEGFPDRSRAQRREAELKRWSRADKLALIRAWRAARASRRAPRVEGATGRCVYSRRGTNTRRARGAAAG